jgi:hypothetical protein
VAQRVAATAALRAALEQFEAIRGDAGDESF